MAMTAHARGADRVGRFVLRRVLGRGAQATVWLGWDDRLEREVAVKLLDTAEDSAAVNEWLHEARAVSRLTHPNIVPVFEAGDDGGRPYLVFEYVPGKTLSQILKERSTLPAREAAALMVGVLDALAAAHAAGIVHRDLKPSNILMGEDGRPRVMDFGIAARVSQAGDGRIVGTPGYMSPEAARGDAPAAAMDVFAAGVVLAQWLTGQAPLVERDPYRAIARVQAEDLRVPQVQGVTLDESLRAITQRALARDVSQRWSDAAQMRQALSAWLTPKAAEDAAAQSAAASGNGTLEFLLRRMRHRSDFPALSDAVSSIQRVSNSENANLSALSDEILKDVALTQKLLRLVNSANFRHAGGGSISTVSRAVALIGFAGTRNLAMSLVLVEHMNDKAHAARLRDEFLRTLMAATLADELCLTAQGSEEAFLVGMMQNLGRLLTEYYFPEEASQIRELCQARRHGQDPGQVQDRSSAQILGISFEELGVGVAKAWGLPETMQRAMRRPEGAPPRALVKGPDQLRWLGHAANEVTEAMLAAAPEALPSSLSALAQTYAHALGVDEKTFRQAAESARARMSDLARALGIHAAAGPAARKLLVSPTSPPPSAGKPIGAEPPPAQAGAEPVQHPSNDVGGEGEATFIELGTRTQAQTTPSGDAPTLAASMPPAAAPQAGEALTRGIAMITQSMVAENFRLDDVLKQVLNTVRDALRLRRVVLCLRDAKTGGLAARLSVGDCNAATFKGLRVPLQSKTPDLFAAVCHKGADLLIADANAANIASRVPVWYRQAVDAPAFLLLPLTVKQSAFGLIYADHAQADGIRIGENELALLRTLRNQAIMAFRAAGAAH